MPDKESLDHTPKPHNPNTKRRGKAMVKLVPYFFISKSGDDDHIEWGKKGDKKLISFGGKEIRVHSPIQS